MPCRNSSCCSLWACPPAWTPPRVAVATEPYPGRWTHHIPLASPQELDEELRGWVHAAYDFAESKGRRGKSS